MYAILISFLFSSLIFLIFGNSFLKILENTRIKNYTVFDSYFIGLSLVGTLLNFWSLFFPTNYISFLILFFIALFLIFKEKKRYLSYLFEVLNKIKNNKLLLLLIIGSVIIVLLFSVVTPKLYDTYLYHINSIQWNEKYKAVPGLANLHERFGFNSSIFVLSASFSFKFIYEQYLFIINSLSYLFFLIWILKLVIDLKNIKSVFLLLFIYYFTNQYYLDISSPGSDLLPNIFLSYLLINLILFEGVLIKKSLVYIILPLFCITLKLSSLPIILLSLISLFFLNQESYFKLIKKFLFLGSLFILPWILRNIIISGYILYPMPSLDFFSFDWKVPAENANLTKEWVYSWGRIPFKDSKEVMSLNFMEWFTVWWKNALLLNKYIYILSIISPVLFIIYNFTNKINREKLVSIFVALIIMILWFFTAPDIRFAYSVILFLALSPILLLEKIIKKSFNYSLNYLTYICLAVTFFYISQNAYFLFIDDYKLEKTYEYTYLPSDVYYVKYKRKIEYNELEYKTPKGLKIILFEPKSRYTQCFDKFPCSWYLDKTIKLRGEDLCDGFVNVKN